jgi:hypothetical protein
MFSISHKPQKISHSFIVLPLIIMSSLNFTLTSFLSRIRSQGKHCFTTKPRGGIYPLPCSAIQSSSRQVLSSNKYSTTRWHARLGHPSSSIVKFVLSKNNQPCSRESSEESVCDACQQVKSHQLSYAKSISVSKSPLELIFFDVCGPASDSIRINKYYVSFIDDF